MKKKSPLRKPAKAKTHLSFSLVHIILPFTITLIGLMVSTQNCARDLNYDTNFMGNVWFEFKGEPYFAPWGIFLAYFVSIAKGTFSVGDIVYQNFKILVLAVFVSVIIFFVLVYIRNFINRQDKEFLASGKIGNIQDLKNNGCLDSCGVVIGQTADAVINASMKKGSVNLVVKKVGTLVMYNFNVCGMLMAGTRLGKGISTVVPTHIMCPKSIISIDPKGENYDITAGWRWLFSKIYKTCPVSKETLRHNILYEIEENFAFRDANMIATILTSPNNPNSTADPHWSETAKVLITATILHVLCSIDDPSIKKRSLTGVYEYLAQGSKKDSKDNVKIALLKNMITSKHCREDIHNSIVNYASQILSAAEEEMGSIFSSALEALSVFNDSYVSYATDDSDFCLNDFKYSKDPISWYLTIPFPDLDRLKSLLRLYIEFVCRKFSQGLTKHGEEPLAHSILFIIDEFPTLGKMETIETFAGILNGYGISFLWICQSKAQIDKLYGENAPILEHCRFMWTYAMNDDNVAQYFSKRTGTEGVIKQNTSISGSKMDAGLNNVSISSDITERPILTANEIENLPPEYELLFTQGGPTQLLKKVAYYSDERFKDKVNLPKPELRKHLLKECKNSLVIKSGDPGAWWEKYIPYQNNFTYEEEDEEYIMPETETDENIVNENNEKLKQGVLI